jgi:hypothetical protein
MAIVSFFDQFPSFEGKTVEIRGFDSYVSIKDLNRILNKRFTDWRKTAFAQELLDELRAIYRMPIDWEGSPSQSRKPLIDYIRGGQRGIYVHPAVAISYCMSNPRFQARINAWLYNMIKMGTATPHVKDWSAAEYLRGVQYNRDDIEDMYGSRRD